MKKDNKQITIDDVKEELKQYFGSKVDENFKDIHKNVFIKIEKGEKYEVRFIKSINNNKIKYGKKEKSDKDPTEIHINTKDYIVKDQKEPNKKFEFIIDNPSTVTKENYNLVKKWCKEDMTRNSIDNINKLITIF